MNRVFGYHCRQVNCFLLLLLPPLALITVVGLPAFTPEHIIARKVDSALAPCGAAELQQ